jgi:hypothetical protein
MDREAIEKYLELYELEELLDYNNLDIVDLLLLAGEATDLEWPYTKPL